MTTYPNGVERELGQISAKIDALDKSVNDLKRVYCGRLNDHGDRLKDLEEEQAVRRAGAKWWGAILAFTGAIGAGLFELMRFSFDIWRAH
ncbi:MAG: hypothetical protein A49_27830 [Methyloceanibacter sp.]|nr:MAG: hypothetical protein A49_27830 [Methyloceanibacter sp.]